MIGREILKKDGKVRRKERSEKRQTKKDGVYKRRDDKLVSRHAIIWKRMNAWNVFPVKPESHEANKLVDSPDFALILTIAIGVLPSGLRLLKQQLIASVMNGKASDDEAVALKGICNVFGAPPFVFILKKLLAFCHFSSRQMSNMLTARHCNPTSMQNRIINEWERHWTALPFCFSPPHPTCNNGNH